MKRLFLAALLVLVLAGCESKTYQVLVTNDSSHDVTFNFRNGPKHTLTSGTAITVETGAHETLEKYSPDKRVSAAEGELEVTFSDRDSYKVKVTNGLGGVAATLSADGWMEPEPALIAASDSAATHGKVHTDKPVFTVEADNGSPARAEYRLLDNGDCMVTIRW